MNSIQSTLSVFFHNSSPSFLLVQITSQLCWEVTASSWPLLCSIHTLHMNEGCPSGATSLLLSSAMPLWLSSTPLTWLLLFSRLWKAIYLYVVIKMWKAQVLVTPSSYFITHAFYIQMFLCSSGDWTQNLTQARQVFYHRITAPGFIYDINSRTYISGTHYFKFYL